jgi:hypothetical protein
LTLIGRSTSASQSGDTLFTGEMLAAAIANDFRIQSVTYCYKYNQAS